MADSILISAIARRSDSYRILLEDNSDHPAIKSIFNDLSI
jgi:hypothetical protein